MRIFLALIMATLVVGAVARAQNPPSCEVDAAKLCDASVPRMECLVRHEKDLSGPCKQEMQRFVEARKQAAGRGGGALTSFGGLNTFGPPIPLVSYDGRLIPGNNGATRQTENAVAISAPVYRGPSETFAVSMAASQVHLGEKLILSSGTAVATDFTRMEIGGQYAHQLPEKKNYGLRASIGYAGDNPSGVPSDMSYSMVGTYGFPGEGRGYWILMVFVANNSPLANYVPIPGVIYMYRSETFSGMFGFPVTSMQWTPVDPWVFSVSVFGVTAQAEAAYGHLDRFQTFLNYGYLQQSFILNVRQDDRDRLTLHEQKIGAGFRLPLFAGTQAEVQAGQSYDRSAYLGSSPLKQDRGYTALLTDVYASAGLKVTF